jgi:subtilase family serine protease
MVVSTAIVFGGIAGPLVSASAVSGEAIAHNTPGYVASAENLHASDPAKIIEITVWLQLHNRSRFDALTQSLYDSKSAHYRHWLTSKEIDQQFAPTSEEAATIRQFVTDHNLKVVKTGPGNFYVRARGTVADVERAFHVQLNDYRVHGKTVRANASDPYVEGAAGQLVRAVSGLDSGGFEHSFIVRKPVIDGVDSATPWMAKPAGVSNDDFFSSQCFPGTETLTFSNNNDGEYPIGTYTGNKLNLASQTSLGCAYTPPVIQKAYHLTELYSEKHQYDGTDQTIAIIDWCGTPTIASDVNAFSDAFGLPELNSTNQEPFLAITYTAPNTCESWDNSEINLDVEWAHAVAPNANINLVVPPSNSFEDIDQAAFEVLHDALGTVLSGSYGAPEQLVATSELETENLISEIGAAEGISSNYATGDYGDFTYEGFPQTVNAPADGPWSTAVGGVSLALNSSGAIAWQSGWGNNWAPPVLDGVVSDPPGMWGFLYGGGGGPSSCLNKETDDTCTGGFAKPSYQSALAGQYRQLPDVSWLADPTTGAVILISLPGVSPTQVWEVVGGTSLATPMFSALWAIANQEAISNNKPLLGQAAPYLYSLPSKTIYDIVPVVSKHNVTASIREATGTNKYDSAQVLGGDPGTDTFYLTAMWDYPYRAYTLIDYSFGTDCSVPDTSPGLTTDCEDSNALKTAVGWDNVTGVGVPNAKNFADYFRNR